MVFGKKESISTLDDALNLSWRLLHKGVDNYKHPFNRPALATMGGNEPEVRTVILREFSEKARTLVCYCDARSPKVVQIQENSNASWLFYHHKKWIQLRLSGTASIHMDDEIADSHWKKVPRKSRINYRTELPSGTPVSEPTSGLPKSLRGKMSELFGKSQARKNFAVIVCRFDHMDWLMLKLTGNLRARFTWKGDRLESSWIIP